GSLSPASAGGAGTRPPRCSSSAGCGTSGGAAAGSAPTRPRLAPTFLFERQPERSGEAAEADAGLVHRVGLADRLLDVPDARPAVGREHDHARLDAGDPVLVRDRPAARDELHQLAGAVLPRREGSFGHLPDADL